MKYRKEKEYTNDYSFGYNQKDFISGNEAIVQAIKTKILLFANEWWENLGIGIPMFQSILGQTNRDNIRLSAQYLVKKRVLEVEEVARVNSIYAEIDDRNLIISVDVTTINSESITLEVAV